MQINGIPCYVYDVEVFINIFHVTILNTESNELYKFEVSDRTNQIQELVSFFLNNAVYFVGYNNIHYDNPIINYCIKYFSTGKYDAETICKSIFNLSRTITSREDNNLQLWKEYKYANNFKTLDLLTMLFSQALRVSLKEMQVTMHFKNVEEFVTDWDKPLSPDRYDDMILYNINDVMSTNELLDRSKSLISLRLSIQKEYNINVLSKDGVGIGTEILKQKYLQLTNKTWDDIKDLRSPMDYIPLKDVILPQISYTTPILQSLLERLKMAVVSPGRKGLEETFILDGTKISVGVGGIHSKNEPEIIIPKDDELLLDTDAASLYPSLLIEYGFVPPHLGKEFLQVYSNIRTERLEAKHNGNKDKNETLKLALNAVTGNYQNEYSWLYSPFAVMQIRMNGQLLLLKLAEMLIAIGCRIIQYNTDGLFLICKKNKKEEYDKVIKEFEQFSRLTMETEEFKGLYQLAINDYFAVTKNGTIKEKGCFITSTKLGKGLTPKIIPKAVINFFINGTPIEETIKSCVDIRDFLMSEKTGKQWNVEYMNMPQQRINRFYASTNGGYLWKWKTDNITKQYQNMLAASGVTLLNKLDNLSTENRNINYRYYIYEAYKLLRALKPLQLSLF